MKFIEATRSKAFWFLDSIKGNKVKHYLTTLDKIEGDNLADEQVCEYQQSKILELLTGSPENIGDDSRRSQLIYG